MRCGYICRRIIIKVECDCRGKSMSESQVYARAGEGRLVKWWKNGQRGQDDEKKGERV